MLKWFKRCGDFWTHDWELLADNMDLGDVRRCKRCGRRQVCVGVYQLDSDLSAMRTWEDAEQSPGPVV